MLGFTAEYASGEIEVCQTELESAGWFHPVDQATGIVLHHSSLMILLNKKITESRLFLENSIQRQF